jgi:hypothetical protein
VRCGGTVERWCGRSVVSWCDGVMMSWCGRPVVRRYGVAWCGSLCRASSRCVWCQLGVCDVVGGRGNVRGRVRERGTLNGERGREIDELCVVLQH